MGAQKGKDLLLKMSDGAGLARSLPSRGAST
jgi:hypothetical protein